MSLKTRDVHEFVVLAASAARTANDNGSAVRLRTRPATVTFILDVTAAATDAGDLLDVYIESKLDGTNWTDVVRFTQITGTTVMPKRYVANIVVDRTQTMFEVATGLGAAAARHLLGDEYRARWVVTDVVGDDASFTFSVQACPE